MKEASGELSMTLVTIIAVAAIVGIIALLMPTIQGWINDKWSDVDKNPTELYDTGKTQSGSGN